MATTSTVPTVKQLLVTKFKAALATSGTGSSQIQVEYCWPGSNCEPEAVFLGRYPEGPDDITVNVDSRIPTIKSGRKQRQEDYDVEFTVWVWRGDLAPTAAATCEARAFAIFADIEDELADDPSLASGAVQHIIFDGYRSRLQIYQSGWVCELTATATVNARLT